MNSVSSASRGEPAKRAAAAVVAAVVGNRDRVHGRSQVAGYNRRVIMGGAGPTQPGGSMQALLKVF